jgi:5-methyltetrahydropteroyltriglutamate--homocysteine methyltransferase
MTGTTAVHICFGYAAIIDERPSGYSFLSELSDCRCGQVSTEIALSHLDCSVLRGLAGRRIMLGVIDLSTHKVETPQTVAVRMREEVARG